MSGLSVNVTTGNVGQAIRISPTVPIVGSEQRFYFDAVPAGSALLALSTFVFPPAGGPIQDLSQWRLSVGPGGATFTPDVPGRYDVRLRDVTVTNLLPHYGGQVFVDGGGNPIGPTDNEIQSPAFGGGAPAPEYTLTVWVAETITRQIGFGNDKATLSLRVFNDQADTTNPAVAPVTLTAGTTPQAKLAMNDPILQQVLVGLQSEPLLTGYPNLANGYLHVLPGYFAALANTWNAHLGQGVVGVHALSDGTNALASTTVTDLPTAIAVLTDMAARYTAHIANSPGAYHASADTINTFTLGTLVTLAQAIATYNGLHAAFDAHAVSTSFHAGALADGAAGEWLEPPVTLADLVRLTSKMAKLYETHRVKTTETVHGTVDTTNGFTLATPSTIGHLCDGVNRLADSMNQHAQNLASTASGGASVAYHANKSTRIVLNRAGDARTAALTLEECWLAHERHLLDGGTGGGAHQNFALGNNYIRYTNGPAGPLTRWPWIARIQKAYRAALDATAPTLPANVSSAAAISVLTYGWTRP